MKESRISRLSALLAYAATLGTGYWWSVNRELAADVGATAAQRAAASGVAFSEGALLLALVSLGHILVYFALLPQLPPQPLARLWVLEALMAVVVLALLQLASPFIALAAPTVLPLLIYGTLLLAGCHADSGVADA